MATAVYLLCALTSTACAVLLVRSHRRTRTRLLLWSATCFAFLAANNLILVVDLVILTDHDLRIARSATALAGVTILVGGFILDTGRERRR